MPIAYHRLYTTHKPSNDQLNQLNNPNTLACLCRDADQQYYWCWEVIVDNITELDLTLAMIVLNTCDPPVELIERR